MANVFIEESILQGWADTVREKTGTSDKMRPSVLLEQTQTNWGTGGGSSGGESVDGVPYIVQASSVTTNTINATASHTSTLYLPKGAEIVAVYVGSARQSGSTGAYPVVKALDALTPDEYTIDRESNASNDIISYTFLGGTYSSAARNTFILMAQYICTAITLKTRNDGLFDAVLVDPNDSTLTRGGGNAFLNVRSTQNFGSISFAEGITSVPANLCYRQPCIESIDLTGITEIGTSAFQNCTNLKSVTFDPQTTSIATTAFSGCKSLRGTLVLPAGLTNIQDYTFSNTKFDKVIFPAGVTEIGTLAFSTNESAALVVAAEYDFSACTSVPTLTGSNAFGLPGNGQVLKIPSALFATWSAATNWTAYADQMVAV